MERPFPWNPTQQFSLGNGRRGKDSHESFSFVHVLLRIVIDPWLTGDPFQDAMIETVGRKDMMVVVVVVLFVMEVAVGSNVCVANRFGPIRRANRTVEKSHE